MKLRPLGKTELRVSPVALGCWPIAGMTSRDVTEADGLATLAACPDLGINFFDTAYVYGADGQSERLIARALGHRRDELVIASKGGIHWDEQGKQAFDGSPQTLRRQCHTSLERLKTDVIDLYYLHAPDPRTPLTESAAALGHLLTEGKVRSVGLSNATLVQIKQFHEVCPLTAIQPPYNMLQREIEAEVLPWCLMNSVSICVYWPLLKGLFAGKLARAHVFQPGDGRAKYPMFQGLEWQKNQDLLDELRPVADSARHTLAELVINWTIQQPGITAALCGAKRVDQITENAAGAGWELTSEQNAAVASALARRGQAVTRSAVQAN